FTHNSIVQALPLRSYLHCPATAVSSWQYSVSFFFLTIPRPPTSTLFPYTTLFRSWSGTSEVDVIRNKHRGARYEVGAETTTTIGDRKSTRLNSSHVSTSYAVFCLKKKTKRSAQRLKQKDQRRLDHRQTYTQRSQTL